MYHLSTLCEIFVTSLYFTSSVYFVFLWLLYLLLSLRVDFESSACIVLNMYKCTRAVQKVSDLNFFRLNKSSMGSFLHCGCGGDIYAHAWISSRLQIASVAGSRSMIVCVLWALGGLSIIAKWRNELSSVIALNFAKSLAILKLKLFERFKRLSGTMPWVSHE